MNHLTAAASPYILGTGGKEIFQPSSAPGCWPVRSEALCKRLFEGRDSVASITGSLLANPFLTGRKCHIVGRLRLLPCPAWHEQQASSGHRGSKMANFPMTHPEGHSNRYSYEWWKVFLPAQWQKIKMSCFGQQPEGAAVFEWCDPCQKLIGGYSGRRSHSFHHSCQAVKSSCDQAESPIEYRLGKAEGSKWLYMGLRCCSNKFLSYPKIAEACTFHRYWCHYYDPIVDVELNSSSSVSIKENLKIVKTIFNLLTILP